MLTSLPLQIFVYFGMWWDVAYWLLSVAIFVYKGQYALAFAVNSCYTSMNYALILRLAAAGFMLPYPTSNYAVEFVFVFLYLLVEPARLFLGASC